MHASGEPAPTAAKAACLLMFAEIVLVSWLGSGARAGFLLPMVWVGVAMFFAAALSVRSHCEPAYVKISFWCGTFVILINAAQIANPSFEYVVCERYGFLEPLAHVSWLPVSVKSDFFAGDALRSLARIISAFSVFMSAALIFRWAKIARLCLAFFAFNATAMAAWGIYQQWAGFPIMYDSFFGISKFYGSFFLSNAAGAFINLGLSANLALVFMSARIPNVFLKISVCAFFLASSAVCVLSCRYSGSNGALAVSAVLCLVFAGACAYLFLRGFLSARISSAFVFAAALSICAAAYFAGSQTVKKNPNLESRVRVSMDSRLDIYKAAFETIKSNAVWGVGGDGAKYYLPQALKQRDRKNDLFVTAERAHSGFLEYIMEFGAVGFSAIAAAGLAWMFRFFRKMRELCVENFILMAGAVLFLMHSCFDIHLHIPSTMIAGAIVAVLAVSPVKEEAQ